MYTLDNISKFLRSQVGLIHFIFFKIHFRHESSHFPSCKPWCLALINSFIVACFIHHNTLCALLGIPQHKYGYCRHHFVMYLLRLTIFSLLGVYLQNRMVWLEAFFLAWSTIEIMMRCRKQDKIFLTLYQMKRCKQYLANSYTLKKYQIPLDRAKLSRVH